MRLLRRQVIALPAGLLAGRAARAQAGPPPAAPMGAYLGPGCVGTARLERFSEWFGRRPERGSDFLSFVSWEEMVKAARRGVPCWARTGLPMNFAVPMLPKDRSSTLARGAAGDYDGHFTRVAEVFVEQGYGEAVVRLGWEFNHGWFPWRAAADPPAWVAFWRRIVTAMRAVPGARFRFDWCTGWNKGEIAPPEVYPGDEFVDIVGMDAYNVTWNPHPARERWQIKLNMAFGLKWQRDFAADHGKPVSIPEWGTGLRPDGRGGGDDPYYIAQMADWIAASPVAYHSYWDFRAPDFVAMLSDGSQPQAEAEFLRRFGGRRSGVAA